MRKNRKSEDSGFNIWRSYSDLMAGVLLLFVLIMCVTLFQAQKSYNDTIKERDEKLALQEEYTAQIEEAISLLNQKESELDAQSATIQSQDQQLADQKAQLATLLSQLEEQRKTLAATQQEVDDKNALLVAQQAQIDKIIGVKAEVVSKLQQEFAKNNVAVNIGDDGTLSLDSSVLFNYDDAELTDEGKAALDSVLPIYCKTLLSTDSKQYLANILIEGYSDPEGDYSYNLDLSEQRALAVAQYLVEQSGTFLDSTEIGDLQQYLAVVGHSNADAILDANGNVDNDASRRVEVKFRLRDEEMISQLDTILAQ